MKTGQRVKAYLERSGIVKKDLAARLGVSSQALNSMLRGNLRSDKIEEIAKAINVSVSHILYDTDDTSADSVPFLINDSSSYTQYSVSGEHIRPPQSLVGIVHLAWRVTDDSMSEKGCIKPGDILFIQRGADYGHRDVLAVFRNGEILIRRYMEIGNASFLLPENLAYDATMFGEESSSFYVIGRVVGMYRFGLK